MPEHWRRFFQVDNLLIVFAAIIASLVVAICYLALRVPSYTASSNLFVSAQTGSTTTAAYQGSLLSEQRVRSYQELISSTRVTREVRDRLRLAQTPQELSAMIRASGAANSAVLDYSVTAQDPRFAALLANTVGETFISLAAQLEAPAPGAAPPVILRMVQPALPPTSPSSASASTILGASILVGLLVGLGLAYIRIRSDTSIRTSDQIERTINASVMAIIPEDKLIESDPLVLIKRPSSDAAERFRQLRTALDFVAISEESKAVIFSSSIESEGKSTTVSNLALALSAAGNKTLLIDADMRRPTVHRIFGVVGDVGLTNVLSGDVSLSEAVQGTGDGKLEVLSTGPIPPNPSELLSSHRMQRVIQETKKTYKFILIDTPPLLPVSDAAALAPVSDGVILVCRFGRAREAHVTEAVENIDAVSGKLLGAVLTMAYVPSITRYANSAQSVSHRAQEQRPSDNGKHNIDALTEPQMPAVEPASKDVGRR